MNAKINTNLEIIEPSNLNAEIVAFAASMMLGASATEKTPLTDLELERRRGVEALQEIGLLVPIDTLDLYHGRVDTQEGHSAWNIDPDYETDNFNAHRVKAVYASLKKKDADDFAYRRGSDRVFTTQFDLLANEVSFEKPETVRKRTFKRAVKHWKENPAYKSFSNNSKTGEEVWTETPIPKPKRSDFGEGPLSKQELRSEAHSRFDELDEEEKKKLWRRASQNLETFVEKIIAKNRDSSIIDLDYFVSNKMPEEQRQRMINALQQMLHEVKPKDTLTDEEIKEVEQVEDMIEDYVINRGDSQVDQKDRINEEEIRSLADNYGLPEKIVLWVASVHNAKQLILESPARAIDLFLNSSRPIASESYDNSDIPIGVFYIRQFCSNNKIIGVKVKLNSSTIDREVETISLFELESISATKRPKF